MSGDWFVAADGRDGVTRLLVDRAKSRASWWTAEDLDLAIAYRRRRAAEYAAGRLHHGDPQVVDRDTAIRIVQDNFWEGVEADCGSPHGQD